MQYDERRRDPLPHSNVSQEGLSDEIISEIYLETLRQLFLSADNFQLKVMRDRTPPLIWNQDPTISKLRIIRDIDWQPLDMGRAPEIVIRSHGSRWTGMNNMMLMDSPKVTPEDPDTIVALIVSSLSVWAISSAPEEAWHLAWEIGSFLTAFESPLVREYGFGALRVTGLSNPVKIRERKDYWGCVVSTVVTWQMAQQLVMQSPRLTELKITSPE